MPDLLTEPDVACWSCDAALLVDFADAASAVAAMRTFFVLHARCSSTEDLAGRSLAA